jgi:hypothetical protein
LHERTNAVKGLENNRGVSTLARVSNSNARKGEQSRAINNKGVQVTWGYALNAFV